MIATSIFSAEDGDRADAYSRLGRFIRTCEAGRPDFYWYESARAVVIARASLSKEFRPVWTRALIWGSHAYEAALAVDQDTASATGPECDSGQLEDT